jgi:hypothetical protein
MKITGGVLAALLFVSTMALGQQHASYAEPFPQSANPALAYGAADESSPSGNAESPSSMSANQSVFAGSNRADLGSPFPRVANPSLGREGDEMAPDNHIDLGSPFPSAANPSNNR